VIADEKKRPNKNPVQPDLPHYICAIDVAGQIHRIPFGYSI
jgi:hypothetical protein